MGFEIKPVGFMSLKQTKGFPFKSNMFGDGWQLRGKHVKLEKKM